MVQYELSLRDYLRIFRKRRFVVIVFIILTTLLSISYTFTIPPRYKSSCKVKVQQRRFSDVLLDIFAAQVQNPILAEVETIKSFLVIENAAKRTGLLSDNTSLAEKKNIILGLQANVETQIIESSNIILISAWADEPKLAINFANAVGEAYVDESLKIKSKKTSTVREYAEGQLKKYEKKLKIAEEVLRKFKETEGFIKLDPKIDAIIKKSSEIEASILTLQEQQEIIKKNIEQIKEEIERPKEFPTAIEVGVVLNPTIQQILARRETIAQKISEALRIYTGEHPDVVALREELNKLQHQLIDEFKEERKRIDGKIEELVSRQKEYSSLLANLPSEELELARLTREVNINTNIYTDIKRRVEEFSIAEAEVISDITIISPAVIAQKIGPSKKLNALLGIALGILLGMTSAFIIENFDTSISTSEDVEKLLGLPVIGVIPCLTARIRTIDKLKVMLKAEKKKALDREFYLISHANPHSMATEAFRGLYTELKSTFFKGLNKTLLVTSTGPSEGKTLIMCNLGVILAQMGNKVLLVNTDFRHPDLNRVFGLRHKPGLTEVLVGEVSLQRAINDFSSILIGLGWDETFKNQGLENLYVLTNGKFVSPIGKLFDSEHMRGFIKDVKKDFDVILFDSPPALIISETAVLASILDGVILVYEAGKTSREALMRVKSQLETLGSKFYGVVLNYVTRHIQATAPYYYHYTYNYRKRPEELKRRKITKIKEGVDLEEG